MLADVAKHAPRQPAAETFEVDQHVRAIGDGRDDAREVGRIITRKQLPTFPLDPERPQHLAVAPLQPTPEQVHVQFDRVGDVQFRASGVDSISRSMRDHFHPTSVTDDRGWTNQVASFPSFHVGWTLDACMAVAAPLGRSWMRVAAMVPAVLVGTAVVTTGNHYLADAIAGFAISVGGWIGFEHLAAARAVGQPDGSGPHGATFPSVGGNVANQRCDREQQAEIRLPINTARHRRDAGDIGQVPRS